MKKFLFILLASVTLLTGCEKKDIFELPDKDLTGFHEIEQAEKVDEGVLYFSGDKILYEKDGNITELATEAEELWREGKDIYYNSRDTLYTYNFDTKETEKMVENPCTILGKYGDSIISYYGKSIYTIQGTEKTRIFADGYYLNKAVLYKNKVYGIPGTNVYEYDLDTLEVKKVTKNKHDLSYFFETGEELYVVTMAYKNENPKKNGTSYFKVTDNGLEEVYSIYNVSSVYDEMAVKDGMFLATSATDDDINAKGNQLLYVRDGKEKIVDQDYYYDIIGILDGKLLYYKNDYMYGTYDENLKTFYLYDGMESEKAFDLDVGYYEDIRGYEYYDGILLEVAYESDTSLYKYDGENLEEIELPEDFYHIIHLAVEENKAYISYADGEETFTTVEIVIDELPEISLMMVGDVLLHENVQESGILSDGTINYDHLFANIKEDVQAADIAIVNQEVILGGIELGLSGFPRFNAPYEVADAIANAGFNVVLHATNHTLDQGKEGLVNCLNYWKTNHPEIAVIGIYDSQEAYDNDIYVYEQDGIKVAILNYSYGTNGMPFPDDMPYAMNLLRKTKVKSDIKRAHEVADFVVVCPHWGTEYQHTSSSKQDEWTQLFLENDVDLVIGTHPHVIQPVEWITDTDGDSMLIYYSLGNFINSTSGSGTGVADRMIGGMAQVTIAKDIDGNTYIKDYGVEPLVTQLSYEKQEITTYKLSDYTESLAETNKVIEKDSAFTFDYCKDLCREVFGELYQE